MRLCREKIRRDKAKLEFNLIIAVKGNKKCVYKDIKKERRTKENFYLLLDVGENTVVRDEADVLEDFFVSVSH